MSDEGIMAALDDYRRSVHDIWWAPDKTALPPPDLEAENAELRAENARLRAREAALEAALVEGPRPSLTGYSEFSRYAVEQTNAIYRRQVASSSARNGQAAVGMSDARSDERGGGEG